jgi:hypothetical protein
MVFDRSARHEMIRELTPPQRHRLRQVFLQVRGPMAFLEPEVTDALALTDAQRERIRELQTDLFVGPGPFVMPKRPDGPPGKPGERFRQPTSPAKVTEQILDELTPEQRTKWQALTGKPFHPSGRFGPG